MRKNERHVWILQRHRVQIERIGKTHIERRAQAELLPHAYRQHSAMHEHRASLRRRSIEDRMYAVIVHVVSMHRWEKTDCIQTGSDVRTFRQRVDHSIRVETDG